MTSKSVACALVACTGKLSLLSTVMFHNMFYFKMCELCCPIIHDNLFLFLNTHSSPDDKYKAKVEEPAATGKLLIILSRKYFLK